MAEQVSALERAVDAFWNCFAGWTRFSRHESVPPGTLRELPDLPALILYLNDDIPDAPQETDTERLAVEVAVAGVRSPASGLTVRRDSLRLRAAIKAAVGTALDADPTLGATVERVDYTGSATADPAGELTPPRTIVFVSYTLYVPEAENDPFTTML